jgi:flagella basal body P-ring formation protein FlgA
MKHFATMALVLLGAAQPAPADTLVLKPEAYVKGPKVLLGDVAEITGEFAEALAKIELAPAAPAGDFKRVNAALVASRMRHAGIDPAAIEISGAPEVRALTLSQEISRQEIADSLQSFILANMPWEPADAQIEVPLPLQDLVAPDGRLDIAWQASPQYGYLGDGAFRGTILVDGKPVRSLTMRAHVAAYASVLTAKAGLPRGKIIGPMDVEPRKVSMLAQPGEVYTRLEDVVGLTVSRSIMAGQPLTPRNLEPPLLIKRGQIVAVEVRVGALHLSDRAKAMQDARANDVITLQNLNSAESFQGIVRDDGVVVIP